MNRLKTKLGKLELNNPVTVASGTFGVEFNNYYDLNILGAMVTKTITPEAKSGNPPQRIYETGHGMLNSIGLQNPGMLSFVQSYLPEYQKYKSPLLVSVSASSINEFARLIDFLESFTAIAGYEINISCPNVEKEGISFGTDVQGVYDLTKKISSITNKEIVVKLTPNVTDVTAIAKAAEDGGATSLALINTLMGMAIDWETGKSYIAKGVCGYSGPAIKPVALQMTYRVSQKVKIPILAMGGICDWKDALEFFYAGASAVAIGTYGFINPLAVPQMLDGLERYFTEKNLTLKDIIGKVSGIK